ncbi:MAG: SURF1 family protein [Acetobacteraceae bacterium]|nr:SURF1 family protein [Acetobacteraceae bacterium]
MSPGEGRLRNGLVLPILFALTAVTTFLALGTWQIERKAWKENLIKTMDQRITAAPIDLPARSLWPQLDASRDEFRQVRFSATFVAAAAALVYAGAPVGHSDTPGPGYFVLALARLPNGDQIVINRGFVPDARKDDAVSAVPSGSVAVTGVMRWAEPRRWFTPKDDPDHNLWFVRDPAAIAASNGWGEVAPFYIDLETSSVPGAFPRPGAPSVQLRNEHLQ